MKKNKGPDLEKYLEGRGRRFVNYAQGAEIYQVTYWAFVRAAKDANSNYPIRKTCIVDLDIFENYLAEYPEVVARFEANRRKNYGKEEKTSPRT